ncbi:hypothetical protein T11_6497 [Trichinella zimbabwensis]|uniref:Uncharacterized protein n=1 Tax=Trichinella zimbabwensis TaxID=268475 RepID=A0A0V1H4M5_9BILA|nr:hypothetical protein T11_6497 [Trichinella zimbabwensis]
MSGAARRIRCESVARRCVRLSVHKVYRVLHLLSVEYLTGCWGCSVMDTNPAPGSLMDVDASMDMWFMRSTNPSDCGTSEALNQQKMPFTMWRAIGAASMLTSPIEVTQWQSLEFTT